MKKMSDKEVILCCTNFLLSHFAENEICVESERKRLHCIPIKCSDHVLKHGFRTNHFTIFSTYWHGNNDAPIENSKLSCNITLKLSWMQYNVNQKGPAERIPNI